MIKGLTTTVISACLAGGVGIGLFFVKHEVKEQEARLAELNLEIQRNQEAIHVLKAEWSYLNDPARLRQLSERFLGMRVMGPSQVASLNTLPRDGGPAMAAAKPAAAAIAKAEPAKPAAAPVVVAAAPKAPEPPKAQAKPEAPKALVKPEAPKALAKAEPANKPAKQFKDDAYRPEPPHAVAAAPARAPGPQTAQPAQRSLVIQSPALAQTQNTAGEVR